MRKRPELHLKKDRDQEHTRTHVGKKKTTSVPSYITFHHSTIEQTQSLLTQLFFFFFLASSSLRLLISMLLELAARHGMLSVEFWRFIGISVDQEKSQYLSQYHVFSPLPVTNTSNHSLPLAVMS